MGRHVFCRQKRMIITVFAYIFRGISMHIPLALARGIHIAALQNTMIHTIEWFHVRAPFSKASILPSFHVNLFNHWFSNISNYSSCHFDFSIQSIHIFLFHSTNYVWIKMKILLSFVNHSNLSSYQYRISHVHVRLMRHSFHQIADRKRHFALKFIEKNNVKFIHKKKIQSPLILDIFETRIVNNDALLCTQHQLIKAKTINYK